MNLRERAERDLIHTLEDPNGAGTPYTIIDPHGNHFSVVGAVGDISLLTDPTTGETIRSRTIVTTCGIKSLTAQTLAIPERGWKAIIDDTDLFIAGNDPDRTLGIYNITMALDLEGGDE
jgi:hypothetical protein